MKKVLLTILIASLVCLALTLVVGAKSVYLEEIPDELKLSGETYTHFVVFEEEDYFTSSNNTILGLEASKMEEDALANGIDMTKVGSEYLIRYNFPAYDSGKLITYVNLNAMKSHKYFSATCGYIQLAGTVNTIHDMNEHGTNLRCIDFGENSQITKIPFYFATSCRKLISLKNMPRNLNSIEGFAFATCYNLRGEIYINAKAIKSSAFNNSLSNVTGLVLGPNVSSIETQAFTVRSGEIPDSYEPADRIPSLEYIEFECDISKISFAKQGNDSGAFHFPVSTARTPYSHLSCIVLSHPDNQALITEGVTVFNDIAQLESPILFNNNDSSTYFVYKSHDKSNSVISYNSYLENGTCQAMCTRCSASSTQVAPALFTNKGYSVPEFGTPSITLGFDVNLDALLAYEASTGKKLNYGLIVAVKDNLGANSPLDESGNAISLEKGQVIKFQVERKFKIFYCKVRNLTTDDYKNAQLVLAGYVQELDSEGNTEKIVYLQDEQCSGSEITSISYNEFING